MASVHGKENSPYWWARYRDAQNKPQSKSTGIPRVPTDPHLVESNKKAALAVAQDWEHKAKNGIPIENPATTSAPLIEGIPTFRVFSDTWIRGLGGDNDYRAKMNGYTRNIGRFLGPKADWPLCHLQRSHFSGLAPFLSEMGYSPTTVTLHLKALRAMCLVAERKGFILASPILPADYLDNPAPIRPIRKPFMGQHEFSTENDQVGRLFTKWRAGANNFADASRPRGPFGRSQEGLRLGIRHAQASRHDGLRFARTIPRPR
jgi:hypothetical protein